MRPVEPYNDEDGGDCMMTLAEFESAVKGGAFVDDDGFGEFATATEVAEDSRIYPSEVGTIAWDARPTWATHVCWYNK